jgi:hypothetical protein
VLPEAINDEVPDWLCVADEDCLAEWNPDVFDNQVAAAEVVDLDVRCLPDRIGVLTQSRVEHPSSRRFEEATSPRAGWHRLSHIDRLLAVRRGDWPVQREVAFVIDGVDPRAFETRRW